jgi:hypothetical protein
MKHRDDLITEILFADDVWFSPRPDGSPKPPDADRQAAVRQQSQVEHRLRVWSTVQVEG